MHLLTNSSPGSDIKGVPASEIKDIVRPFLSLLSILGISLVELNLRNDFKVDFMPYLIVNFL